MEKVPATQMPITICIQGLSNINPIKLSPNTTFMKLKCLCGARRTQAEELISFSFLFLSLSHHPRCPCDFHKYKSTIYSRPWQIQQEDFHSQLKRPPFGNVQSCLNGGWEGSEFQHNHLFLSPIVQLRIKWLKSRETVGDLEEICSGKSFPVYFLEVKVRVCIKWERHRKRQRR